MKKEQYNHDNNDFIYNSDIAIKRRLYIRISMGSLAIVNKCQVVDNTLDDI